jgi:hypothetical protein
VSARIDNSSSGSTARLAAFNTSPTSGANSIQSLHLDAYMRPEWTDVWLANQLRAGVTWLQPSYR